MAVKRQILGCLVVLVGCAEVVRGQEETSSCYGAGSITAAVILTFITTAVVLGLLYLWWKKYKAKKEHLILETDPEKGKGEYAFDNAGFKDTTLFENMCKPEENSKLETSKPKWSHWSPLAALTTKSEKRKTLDDSALENNEVKVVALRSYDFTGLGFNICGNIKDGIYIKDISHRGPAFVSGKLNPGDRISSITISFEHIVYEDALNILSYASPYEVIIEAKSGKVIQTPTQGGQPIHPMYKSTSCTNLWHSEKSPDTRLLADTPNSSLQKQKNHVTSLERKDSKSPNVNQGYHKKSKPFKTTPEQIKPSSESRLIEAQPKAKERLQQKSDLEVQKTENKFQKFGVKVLPVDQKSPKTHEQNENNINIEKLSIDEVDDTKTGKPSVVEKERFERGNQQGSGIKRDKDGIPQEIPVHMLNAAVAAKRNRNSMTPKEPIPTEPKEEPRTPKKKGKAPSPPEDSKTASQEDIQKDTSDSNSRTYNTDSEEEIDNNSSVNTMELNSSDITIHQTEQHEDNKQNRKTVSTGDLTRIQNTKKTKIASGTLERAQSLDISESTIPPPLHKENLELMRSEEDLFGKVMLSKEPRLSLILDGLNTFQRNRLKKSTEWGNLEDAILKLNQEDDSIISLEDNQSLDRSSLNETSPEFDAVVNKINEIKRESVDGGKSVKNAIWPNLNGEEEIKTPKLNNGLGHFKPIEVEIEEEVTVSKPQVDSLLETPTKPISPPRLKKVNNRIDEPFEKAVPLSTAENRQVKASVAVELPPEVILEPLEPPKVMKRVSRQRVPDDSVVLTLPSPEQSFPDPPTPEWEENIMNTSPPPSLTIDDPSDTTPKQTPSPVKPEEVLSQIPLLNTMVQNETTKKTVLLNNTDEAKRVVTYNSNILDLTQNFLYTEQLNSYQDDIYPFKMYGTNVSDDIKVSRHTQNSPKSDDAKSKDSHRHVSNINVTNSNRDLHSLEFSVNEDTDHYTTALDVSNVSSIEDRENGEDNRVTILTPDLIKNVTLAEAIQTLEKEHEEKSSSDSLSLTYVTEIQVTPQNSLTNVSEIEVLSGSDLKRNLDTEFENYVKSFEAKLEQFESNIHGFDQNLEEFIKEEPKSIVFNESIDEQELNKIHEIAEEQLKKLPEMRFTTASYEAPSKLPEKRSSIEQLKSNFEKSPSKSGKSDASPKSRIPIATTTKTPPMSPERRDSRTFDTENDKALLELITSTPYAAKPKPSSKNVTVTSIRTTSKIPSGLPTLSGRPPVAPRKPEPNDNTVHVPVNGNETHNSFKQWVFNPSNVTNVTVTQNKTEK